MRSTPGVPMMWTSSMWARPMRAKSTIFRLIPLNPIADETRRFAHCGEDAGDVIGDDECDECVDEAVEA